MISVISRATPRTLKASLFRPHSSNIANSTSTTTFPTSSRLTRATATSYRAYLSTSNTHTRRTMASAPPSAASTASTLPTPASSTHSNSPPASNKSNPATVPATPSILAASTHRPLIDTAAIDAQMKLASLNHLAGYTTKSYPDAVPQSSTTTYTPEEMARGYEVLREPFFNKGAYLLAQFLQKDNSNSSHRHILRS